MTKLLGTIFVLCILLVFCQAQGTVYVPGYYRANGTWVPPHYQTALNGNLYDNRSTKGNINPYTGQPGWISQPRRSYYDSYGVWHPPR